MTVLVTTPTQNKLANMHSLLSPNTLALRGRFNASEACLTKQHGCSSEGQTGHTGWHWEDAIAKPVFVLIQSSSKYIAHKLTVTGFLVIVHNHVE